eukprot:2707706-Rhodomonas_salina.2
MAYGTRRAIGEGRSDLGEERDARGLPLQLRVSLFQLPRPDPIRSIAIHQYHAMELDRIVRSFNGKRNATPPHECHAMALRCSISLFQLEEPR